MGIRLRLPATAIVDLYQSDAVREDGQAQPIYCTLESKSPVEGFGSIRAAINDHRYSLQDLEAWCGLPVDVDVYAEFSVFGTGKNSSMTLRVEALEISDKYGARAMAELMSNAPQSGRKRPNGEPAAPQT